MPHAFSEVQKLDVKILWTGNLSEQNASESFDLAEDERIGLRIICCFFRLMLRYSKHS
jgi:hypothetical protein